MKNEKILGAALIGFALWQLSQPPKRIVPPPRPPGNNLNANYQAWLAYAQIVAAQAQKLFGSVEKVIDLLWGPGGPFYNTPIPEYDAGSQFWDDVEGLAGLGKIYDSYKIKPHGRVDDYWDLKYRIDPSSVGVTSRREKFYFDPQEGVKHFRLYGIEFGNWVPQDERGDFMFATLATLADMAKVVGASQPQMGMGGKLHLAFGARGKGGFAAAFYQRHPYHLINLTRPHGRFTFCHEYGHALDAEAHFRRYKDIGYISDGRSIRKTPDYEGKRPGTPEHAMETALEKILWNEDGSHSSYHRWLIGTGSKYLNLRTEIWARTIEGFFRLKFDSAGISNTWGIPKNWGKDWPKPELVERAMPHIQKVINYSLK